MHKNLIVSLYIKYKTILKNTGGIEGWRIQIKFLLKLEIMEGQHYLPIIIHLILIGIQHQMMPQEIWFYMVIIPLLTCLNKTSVRILLLTIHTGRMVPITPFSEIEQKDLVFSLVQIIHQIRIYWVMKFRIRIFPTVWSTTLFKESATLYIAIITKE